MALLSAVLTMPVLAQDSSSCNCTLEPRKPSALELRSSGIVSFAQSRPTGAFARNIGFGYGALGTYLVRLDNAGVFSLRADGGLLGYGYESFYAPLSTTIGGRIQVKVSTTNYVLPLSLGPQIAWPRCAFRPYANAGIATQILYTQTGAEGADDSGDYPSTTNQSDWTGAWVLGAGVYMPVYELNTKVAIDVGVQYFTGGHAQYLRRGSIEDLPNAQIRITPLESDTHMMLVRIGVKIGL
jgi:hypothetical protein